MTKSRKRRIVSLPITVLEGRRLLATTPVAVWIGQDGHDLAGGPTAGVGDGIMDVHIGLSSLPANDPIETIQMLGYGAGEWDLNVNSYSRYGGVLEQAPGASTADWFVDVYQNETGRPFTLTITFADNTTSVITMNGGTANANLRMPAAALTAQWLGQDGHDLTGQSVSVGPDGFQDAHLSLGHIDATTTVSSVTITDPLGDSWGAGTNPNFSYRAEFVSNPTDATLGDLYFSPNRDLNGQALTVTVIYANGSRDQTTVFAGATNPSLAMPAQASTALTWTTLGVHWLGQNGVNLAGAGAVDLSLTGIPAGRTVLSATVSDTSNFDWTYTKPGSNAPAADPLAWGMAFQAGSNSTTGQLSFAPVVNETGATLTVVLTLDDGTILASHVSGGTCDPGLITPGTASTSFVAHPGDDLNALANTYGTVRLVAGLYPMDAPLVLNHPVTITADPGAILVFSQGATDPVWSTAIKVRSSHTTLNGFTVRFAGPIRWASNVSYGPAVIGWSDNLDPPSSDPGVDLTFTNLDLQDPPAATSWEEAPSLFRLVGASSGVVANNALKGGTTELTGGPWQVTGNNYLGTVPDTYTYCAFGTHSTRDLTLSGNTAEPSGPSGKTWRFLVMTDEGVNDVVANNQVVGIGPMDTDTMPSPNASEVILTEAYAIHYEGMVSSVSADGMTVQIPTPQGGSARTGDLLAILSGPQAGQWRTIAQMLSPTTYLLDSPITPGRFAISIDTGFAGETFQGNTVDCRGSSAAGDLVLVGNQFGLTVENNTFLGGNVAFKITACPSETPVTWGWTHAPLLGALISGNTFEDSIQGGLLDVEHNASTAADAGRVYFSGTFRDNIGIWTAPFLAARSAAGNTSSPVLVTVGDSLSIDPGEMALTESGNEVEGPSAVVSGQTFEVVSGSVNGQVVRNTGYVLPVVGSAPMAVVASVPAPMIEPTALVTTPVSSTVVATVPPPTIVKVTVPVPAPKPTILKVTMPVPAPKPIAVKVLAPVTRVPVKVTVSKPLAPKAPVKTKTPTPVKAPVKVKVVTPAPPKVTARTLGAVGSSSLLRLAGRFWTN